MPEVYNAAKQGPRELPDGHPHKGGAVFFKPRQQLISPPLSAPEDPVSAAQGSAQGEELPDPMPPPSNAVDEKGKRDLGERHNLKP
ncbi:MAG: hypothetical protein JNJ67_07820 [Chromatiales bacterium]|nr:hypothetical protein [Chromatiales bacterium]